MLKDREVFSVGTPETVLNLENIRAAYGVEARVTSDHDGKPYVVPISPVNNQCQEGLHAETH